jgi:hypothetical protein
MKRTLIVLVALGVAITAVFVVPGAADPDVRPRGLGNHSLKGVYEFHADGVVEVNGEPKRGFWEVGRFKADGKGTMTNGVEYSSMLSNDESVIDQNFTFSGTYSVKPDGTATANVTVQIPNGPTIQKKLWFVLHSVGKDGVADGFAGGHADADLGGGTHGNARVHEGNRIG